MKPLTQSTALRRHRSASDDHVRCRISWGWALAAVGAVVYGSLIPFNLDLTRINTDNGFGLLRITLLRAGLEDLCTNVLVYIPIGLTLAACGTRRRINGLGRLLSATAAGIMLSILLEAMQTSIAARVASWLDVVCNSLGCLTGAILGIAGTHIAARCIPRLRRRIAARPFVAISAGLTIALFIYNIAPFGFVTSTTAMQKSFLNAQWSITAPSSGSLARLPFALVIQNATAAAWFALLAYFRALDELERGRHPAIAFGSAVKHTVVLVVIIEFMQLFTTHHVFEFTAIGLGTLAAVLGGWSAVYLVDVLTGSHWRQRRGHAMPTAALVMIAAVQIAALLLSVVNPQIWLPSNLIRAPIQWLPFQTLWWSPMPDAACEIAGTLITYGTLTMTLGMILRRLRVRRPWLAAGAAVISTALFVQVIRATGIFHALDLTDPVLATFASILAARAYLAVQSTAVLAAPRCAESACKNASG